MKKYFIFFLLLLSSNISFSQGYYDVIRNLYSIRDSRDISKIDLLMNGISSEDKDISHICLYALADMGDTSVVKNIGSLLNESTSDYTKMICAYVLGQLNSKTSVAALESALDKFQSKPELVSEIINALGKIGDKNSLDKVCQIKSSDPLVNIAIGTSIGRFGARRISDENSVSKLKELLSANDLGVNRAAGYGLLRTADAKLLAQVRNEIFSMLRNKNDHILRAWGFSTVARFKDAATLDTMIKSLSEYSLEYPVPFPSYSRKIDIENVTIAKLNALGTYDLKTYSEKTQEINKMLLEYLFFSNGNIKITAMNTAGKLLINSTSDKTSGISEKLKTISSQSSNPASVRAAALNNFAIINKEKAKNYVLSVLSSDPSFDMKRAAIDACVNLNDPLIFKEIRDSITKVVERYVATHPDISREIIGSNDLAKIYRGYTGLLTNYIRTPDVNDQNTLRLIFGEFLSSKDAEIVGNCIQGLSDSIYVNNSQWNDEDKLIFDFEFKTLKLPEDFDVMTSFIDAAGDLKINSLVPELVKLMPYPDYMIAKKSSEALKKITGDDFPLNYSNFINNEKIDKVMNILHEKYNAEINTSKGKITIELFGGVAPFTVLNFIDLANKNFFDGTIFHRVVPNFVIQGGDNTGTGFGSPDYSIRSEFSSLTYGTGVVGMASSGKDTEGSQFFITHSPQFHLDGRYTIFGFVTEGMDVVNKIIIGDKIESVKIIKK